MSHSYSVWLHRMSSDVGVIADIAVVEVGDAFLVRVDGGLRVKGSDLRAHAGRKIQVKRSAKIQSVVILGKGR